MNDDDFKNSIKLSGRIAWAFTISALVLWVSFVVSRQTDNWMWFSRSGSILVCIGVITAAYDIKGKMEKHNAPDEYVSQTIRMEASVVIVGTLVWGFGDLFGVIF